MNITKLLGLFVRPASAHCDTEDGPAVTHQLLAVGLHQAAALAREVRDQKVVFVVLADLPDVGAPEDA